MLGKGERSHDVIELQLLQQLLGAGLGPALDTEEQLLAEPVSDVGIDEDPRDTTAAISHGPAHLGRVVGPADYQGAPSLEDLEHVDAVGAVRHHHLLELLQARRVHRDVEPVPLLLVNESLRSKSQFYLIR